MRTRRPEGLLGSPLFRIHRLAAPFAGVVVLLAGLGFLLTPDAPAAAAPPAQGWTTTEAPLPNDAGTNPQVYTASSTCPAANACVTVGYYKDSGGHAWGLIEQQNGTGWTDTEAPQPNNAGSGADQEFWFGSSSCGYNAPCRAVSCPTTTFCVAVGSYDDTSGNTQPVVDTLANGTWTSQEGGLPNDTATDGGSATPDAYLYSVSCTSTSSCVAVGAYRNTSGTEIGLIDTLSGTTWTGTAVPMPSGVSASESSFYGVDCSGSTCAAVGQLSPTAGGNVGLVATLSNGTWTSAIAPLPSDGATGTSEYVVLIQVVCPDASTCVAVGLYFNQADDVARPLIESWNGTTWTALAGPVPADQAAGSYDQLNAVSCGSPTSCVAVGDYGTSSHEYGLIDTLAGGAWTGMAAPQPSGSTATGNLNEVSCPNPTFCLSVGYYEGGPGGSTVAMVDRLSVGSWTSADALVPSNVSTISGITLHSTARTVACDSPVACTVAGWYNDTSAHQQGFLDTWTGPQGYWLDASDGGIFSYPNNAFFGSTGGITLNKPMVGMATTADGQGYWLVASDGGIFNYGDATFHGSRGGQPLNKPIVGMAATPDGGGYWLVASDGGIFSYGDAGYYGSRGGQPINAPIVGMATTPDGKGYWLVGADGGIYNYGDAGFLGSAGALRLNAPVVGMAATPDGLGYWLVASDGGIFNYGDANFYGSTGSLKLNKPVVGMAGSPSGQGYWLVASDGGVFNYGDATFQGSAGALHLNAPVVGMAGG